MSKIEVSSKYKVGDHVRLTGKLWGDEYGLGNQEVIIAGVDYEGAYFNSPDSGHLYVYEPLVHGKDYVDDWCGELIEYDQEQVVEGNSEPDMVNHPPHYVSESGIEVIDVIEAFDLDRYRANATKYILRAGNKGDFNEDVKKAIWYLERLLKWREDHAQS